MAQWVYGTDIFWDDDDHKVYLNHIEVEPESIEQYFGKIHCYKYPPGYHEDDWDLQELWARVRFVASSAEKMDGAQVIGNRIIRSKKNELAIKTGFNLNSEKVHSSTMRQIVPEIIDVYRNNEHVGKSRLWWRGDNYKIQPLLRAKYNSQWNPAYENETVYCYGEGFLSDGRYFEKDFLTRWDVHPNTIEQLISEIPEIWVPLKYRGLRIEYKEPKPVQALSLGFETDFSEKKCYVYVLNLETGIIKIGFSNKTERRISEIEREGGVKVTKVFYKAFNTSKVRKVESKMHQIFHAQRKFREYFEVPFEEACRKLEEIAEDYKNGKF